ncbi:MAG: CotH kinase family protein [Fibrobacter sp.]|nr:CotH kinase family protein [Fibrobacter sp.]
MRKFFGILLCVWAAILAACSGDNSTTVQTDLPIESSESEEGPQSAAASSSSEEDDFTGSPVVFTELDPINTVYDDHEGGDAGWVELYNRSNSVVNISGYGLTDSPSNLKKWVFGNVSIPAKSYMLVFLSGKDYPDYVAPSDTVNLIGPGCWTWTDSQNTPIAGYSTVDFLPGKRQCFSENGNRAFGGTMRYAENVELGWHSISFFVGTGTSSPEDMKDLSKTNEILMKGFITQNRILKLGLAQPDLDDWKGWSTTVTGTGDSNTTYTISMPTGSTFPDLAHIYGTRFSPDENEVLPLTFKITSYIARNRGHEPHTNFKVKKSGGNLYLIDKAKAFVDSVKFPSMPTGESWSLSSTNGKGTWGFAKPSPYAATAMKVQSSQAVAPTKNLPPSGFYRQPFEVTFPSSESVRCEEGGYEPTSLSPLVTSKNISGTIVLRCASFVANKLRSDIVTRTYVFEDQPKTPVVFLTGNPKSFFDPDTGIYMEGNYAQESDPHFGANYWADREIPIHVELIEPGFPTPAFSENAGYQIFGNYSRANAKKSAAIVFREKYGSKRLSYTLFPDFPALTKFKVFLLRNNGGNYGADYIRDRLCSSVTEGLGLDYQRGRGSVVYYNGEYFGIHNIRERSTEYYFETHYGMDPDEVDLLKADNSATAGSSTEYTALMNWLETNHLDNQENFDYVASQIDVDNFLNYMETEIFMNNRDWPANNLKKWRGTNPKTKWKWFIYDMDFGFGNEFSEFKNNIFEYALNASGPDYPNGPASTLLLRRLLENESFKAAFINRMTTLLSMNFESGRLLARINALMSEVEYEIPKDQKRWNLNESYMDGQLEKMRTFAKSRQQVILDEMQEYFGLENLTPVTLSTSGRGAILVHNLSLDNSSMTIKFFKGMPVTLTAKANGGMFMGWSDGEMSETRTILPEDVESLTAIFE